MGRFGRGCLAAIAGVSLVWGIWIWSWSWGAGLFHLTTGIFVSWVIWWSAKRARTVSTQQALKAKEEMRADLARSQPGVVAQLGPITPNERAQAVAARRQRERVWAAEAARQERDRELAARRTAEAARLERDRELAARRTAEAARQEREVEVTVLEVREVTEASDRPQAQEEVDRKRAEEDLARRAQDEVRWRETTDRARNALTGSDAEESFNILLGYAGFVADELRRVGVYGEPVLFFQIDCDVKSEKRRISDYQVDYNSNVDWRCLWLDVEGQVLAGYHSEYRSNGHTIAGGDNMTPLTLAQALEDWTGGVWSEESNSTTYVGRRRWTRIDNPSDYRFRDLLELLEDLLHGRSDGNIHTNYG